MNKRQYNICYLIILFIDYLKKKQPIFLRNNQGTYSLENLEFPEDFPVTQGGQYFIEIEDTNNPEQGYGQLEKISIEVNISPVGGDPKKKRNEKFDIYN